MGFLRVVCALRMTLSRAVILSKPCRDSACGAAYTVRLTSFAQDDTSPLQRIYLVFNIREKNPSIYIGQKNAPIRRCF